MSVIDKQCHRAIDLIISDDWVGSHKIVQDLNTPIAQWIHAVLHKIEGDEANSRYWYSRSGLYFYDSYNDLQHELRVIKSKLPN
jgi:hypothetical protein